MPDYKDLEDVLVEDVYKLIVAEPATINLNSKLVDAVRALVKNPQSQEVYVLDDEKKLVGIVTMETILRQIGYIYGIRKPGIISFFKFLSDVLKEDLIDFMEKKPVRVTKKDKIFDALKLMFSYHLNNLPVVDEKDVVIGELNGIEILIRALERK
ncbi:MAG: CBS domain-containing protein [Candidatus Thermoplasmatota archaeon]